MEVGGTFQVGLPPPPIRGVKQFEILHFNEYKKWNLHKSFNLFLYMINPLIAAVAILRHTFYYPPVPWPQYSDHKTEKTVMFYEWFPVKIPGS